MQIRGTGQQKTRDRARREGGAPPWRRYVPVLLCLVVPLLGACDSINPINWYRDLAGTAADDPGPHAKNGDKLDAASGQPYPNLDSVPNPPVRGLTSAERENLTEGLVADRSHAHYVDEKMAAGDASAVMPESPSTPVGAGNDAPVPPATDHTAGTDLGAELQPQTPAPAPPPPSLPPVPPPQPPAGNGAPAQVANAGPAASATPEAPPPAPALAPSAAVPEPAQSQNKRVTNEQVAAIDFPSGATAVPETGLEELASLPAMHKQHGGLIRVVSHATIPTEGAEAPSQALASYQTALQQAQAVKQRLVDAGVSPSDVVAEVSTKAGGTPGKVEIYLEY